MYIYIAIIFGNVGKTKVQSGFMPEEEEIRVYGVNRISCK